MPPLPSSQEDCRWEDSQSKGQHLIFIGGLKAQGRILKKADAGWKSGKSDSVQQGENSLLPDPPPVFFNKSPSKGYIRPLFPHLLKRGQHQ